MVQDSPPPYSAQRSPSNTLTRAPMPNRQRAYRITSSISAVSDEVDERTSLLGSSTSFESTSILNPSTSHERSSRSAPSTFYERPNRSAPSTSYESTSHSAPFTSPKKPAIQAFITVVILVCVISLSVSGVLFVALGTERHRGLVTPGQQESLRRGWEKELKKHRADHAHFESDRQRWANELRHHRDVMANETAMEENRRKKLREDFERERSGWAQKLRDIHDEIDRTKAEETRRREDEMKRRHPIWGPATASERCTAWNTREYTARLFNIPFENEGNGMQVCMSATIETRDHGPLHPEYCQDFGIVKGVHGHWHDYGDQCRGDWVSFSSRCSAPRSGKRLWQGRLLNLPRTEDRLLMCTTAGPMSVGGMLFEHPSFCEDKGSGGLWGFWEVSDPGC